MSKKQVAGYILDRRIGKGSYATVWKGREEGRNEAVAVKVISRQTVTETAQLRQEVEVLRKISHPNIVRFRDLKKSAAHFYLVLEYCAGGDLSQFLRERGHVPEETARRFLTQIAEGLCVLHQANVLHRDLKPQNILLSDCSAEPVLKIADFGFARALQPQDMAATVCGSPLYMAPEILRHEPYDAKADLWSVGAILYELLLGRTPFSGANPMQLLANIEKSTGLSFEGVQLSTQGQDFLRSLLVHNPAQRLSSQAFMQHAYVRLPSAAVAGASASAGAVAVGAPSGRGVGGSPLEECSADGSFFVASPIEWCSADAVQGAMPSSGAVSPAAELASPVSCRSPEESPRETNPDPSQGGGFVTASSSTGSAHGGVTSPQFELACETSPASKDGGEPHEAESAPDANAICEQEGLKEESAAAGPVLVSGSGPMPAEVSAAMAQAMMAATSQEIEGSAPAGQKAGPTKLPAAPRQLQRNGSVDEDYVVVTAKTPISAFARGKGPTPAAAASGFCSNLSRIARALEQLAMRLAEQAPVEALSLLLRALGLLEKALKVSLDEDSGEPLRRDFAKMLAAADEVGKQVRASCNSTSTEKQLRAAQPNSAIFEFAVQQAKDAAVVLSKGHEAGGWEAPCHEKLSLALLLLDLLASEADGEDVPAIAAYTAPIARLAGQIERRLKSQAATVHPAGQNQPTAC